MTLIHGCTSIVMYVIQGAEVNTRDHCGWTPLHEACNHGYIEMTLLLLDNGARVDDPGGVNCGGVTPLMDAATNGHEDVIKLLVGRGADLALQDTHVSEGGGHGGVVKLLVLIWLLKTE